MTNCKQSFLVAVSLIIGVCLLPVMGMAAGGHDSHDHAGTDQHADSRKGNHQQSSDEPYSVRFGTHPEPAKIIPDSSMVELMFNVKDDGKTAKNVNLSYRVYAPPENFWFGTDFPVVEGTQLLSGTVHLPDGKQVISMILPIRGEYTVKTTVRGAEGVAHGRTTFSVPANSQEVFNLSVFLLILFLVGGVGGYFLKGNSGSERASSLFMVAMVLGGICLVANPADVYAHGQGNWDPHTLENQLGVKTMKEGTELSVKTFPTPVSVGEMLNVRYRVQSAHSVDQHQGQSTSHAENHEAMHANDEKVHGMHGSPSSVLAESHFVLSEGGLEMVKQAIRLEQGRGEINVQLIDGADHYLVTRFYRPTGLYGPASGHEHGHGGKHESKTETTVPTDNGPQERTAGTHAKQGHVHKENHGQKSRGKHKASSEKAREGHHELDPSWEAELRYTLEPGNYTLSFQKSSDPAMKWLLLPASVDHLRETALNRMKECRTVQPKTNIEADGQCYNLVLNDRGTTHQFTLPEGGNYVMFTQHLPREFDMTLEQNGTVIEPRRKFIKGKGEYLGRSVKYIELNAVQPPFDDIFKSMVTLLAVVALGFLAGYKGPNWVSGR